MHDSTAMRMPIGTWQRPSSRSQTWCCTATTPRGRRSDIGLLGKPEGTHDAFKSIGIDEDQSSKVDALQALDQMVSTMSPERRDALLELVNDFIDLNISNGSC